MHRLSSLKSPISPSGCPQYELRLTSLGGLAMLGVGILTAIPVSFVGRVFIGEVLLGLVSPFAIPLVLTLPGPYGRVARMLLAAMVISWAGYVASDMYRATPSLDYLRGWSRWAALIAAYSTLAWLGSKSIRYVVYFLLGWSVGSIVYPLVTGGFSVVDWWKFHAGVPACIIAAYFAGKAGKWIASAAMVGMGGVSVVLNTRSLMLAAVLAGGVSLIAGRTGRAKKLNVKRFSKQRIVLAIATLSLCAVAAVSIVNRVGETYGYKERFERSNVRRMVNAEVAYKIIKASPVIGYGSWARDPSVARIRDEIIKQRGESNVVRGQGQEDLVIVHSQVLQAWVEGGLLGLTFFVIYGWHLASKLLALTAYVKYNPLTPIMGFVLIMASWHFFASPFSGAVRVLICTSCVFAGYIAQQTDGATSPISVPQILPRQFRTRQAWG